MAGEDSEQRSVSTKFPRDKTQYVLTATSGTPDSATVYNAKHVNPTTGEEVPVGIKILNMYKIEDIYSFTTQLHEAETCDHENIIRVHCSFKIEDQLWVIMSPPGMSVRSMIRSSFRHGLPENVVAFILNETLKALHYMHESKNNARDNIGAACIFLDEKFRVKMGFSSLITCEDHRSNITFAPEIVIDHYRLQGKNKATDIWMFGLLALELFYGLIPASDFKEFQLLVTGIENEFGILKKQENRHGFRIEKLGVFSCFYEQKKKIPQLLGEVMAACLSRDPETRPTTNQLMGHEMFQKRFTGQQSLAKLMKKAGKYS